MGTALTAIQVSEPWHRQGLYMGMHWAWWLFWIAAIAIGVWAFWRLAADRREARHRVSRMVAAEQALRDRFTRGEVTEAEFLDGMRALGASGATPFPARRSS